MLANMSKPHAFEINSACSIPAYWLIRILTLTCPMMLGDDRLTRWYHWCVLVRAEVST